MADNLPPSSADVTESGSLNLPEPSGPHRLVLGIIYFLHPVTAFRIALFQSSRIFTVTRTRLPQVQRPQTSQEGFFNVVRTVHFGIKLYNDQRNAHVFNLFIYLLLPYMFRAFFLTHLQRQAHKFGSCSSLLGMVSAPLPNLYTCL
jgi:hypothetical protein